MRDGAVKVRTVPGLDRLQAQPKREMSGQVFELARALKSVPELADADLSLSLGDAGDYAGNPPGSRLISVAGPVMPFGWLSGVCRPWATPVEQQEKAKCATFRHSLRQ